MGRVIKADTIRLDDFVAVDAHPEQGADPFALMGRKGWVDSIVHATPSAVDVTLVDVEEWPVSRADVPAWRTSTVTLSLNNSPYGADFVWRM